MAVSGCATERQPLLDRLGDSNWGCLLVSAAPRPRLLRHLRSLLEVRSPAGERWLFRFWDPRVLPTFVRASGPAELNAFFGPVESFAVVGGDGQAFAAWRAPDIVAPPPRRAVGQRLAITPAQVTAPRGAAVADRLARTFPPPYQSKVTPTRDAVLVRAPDGGVTRFGLGDGGLIDGVTSPNGRHWAIDAHEDGRLARMVTPSGSTLTIGYDSAGRIADVARDGAERFRATHDRDGRLTRVDFPDGTAAEVDHAWQGRAALGDPDGTLVAG
jgi:YD repeat-containing protein